MWTTVEASEMAKQHFCGLVCCFIGWAERFSQAKLCPVYSAAFHVANERICFCVHSHGVRGFRFLRAPSWKRFITWKDRNPAGLETPAIRSNKLKASTKESDLNPICLHQQEVSFFFSFFATLLPFMVHFSLCTNVLKYPGSVDLWIFLSWSSCFSILVAQSWKGQNSWIF